jgi:hypothetical protein
VVTPDTAHPGCDPRLLLRLRDPSHSPMPSPLPAGP